MPRVIIDNIEYIPKADIPELTDENLNEALRQLTSMLYFREHHKSMPHAWNVLDALAPELAKLASDSPKDAYYRVHDSD
jgi:hypothetical protein